MGTDKARIVEIFRVKADCYETVMDMNKENTEMLRHIHMAMFLKNLEISGGLISDSDNLRLLNAELKRFHLQNNL